jgi:hypothetical protein
MPPLERCVNQIFSKMPSLVGEHYIDRIPVWIAMLLRMAFGIGAIVLATMFYLDWSNTSLGWRAFACVLVPAFTFAALHKEVWGSIRFIADDRGIFFPCNDLPLITVLGQKHKESWLLVPWSNISNLRLAKYLDNDNDLRTCVALDLKVSKEERASFFQRVGAPTDSPNHSENLLSIAYGGTPPSPERVFKLLKELELRHNNSFQWTRRDDAASHP